MNTTNHETATLGGGCFWCLEAVYEQMEGVISIKSGYSGGARPNPSYDQVCSGATGHAEVVQVEFDPAVTTYREILQIFFTIHDPTTLDRQGNDVGSQYRSIIFYHSDEQQGTARNVMEEIEKAEVFPSPVVTEVVPLEKFYSAETHHQDYYARNQSQPYCQYVIAPKVAKIRKLYFDKLKKSSAAGD
jgi:peptide-methionine (S)-S-oxide reductase